MLQRSRPGVPLLEPGFGAPDESVHPIEPAQPVMGEAFSLPLLHLYNIELSHEPVKYPPA